MLNGKIQVSVWNGNWIGRRARDHTPIYISANIPDLDILIPFVARAQLFIGRLRIELYREGRLKTDAIRKSVSHIGFDCDNTPSLVDHLSI